ncbi:uncharacterized protein METZ01_LOCUS38639 [marine metagenome]|uniref:Uncharacterized protein n=1 Tax=marine metagenome TaxID=408172 RepID=A0A381R217_9ZZZZ
MQKQNYIIIALLLANLLVFGPVAGYEFLSYDDGLHVYENERVVNFSTDNLIYFWKNAHKGLYIPISYNLWALQAKFSQYFPAKQINSVSGEDILNPAIFHTTNLLLHALSTIIVFLIIRKLIQHDLPAGVGALFFAIHPVQVEAVAWISELKGCLSSLFSLLAIWQYICLSKIFSAGNQKKQIHYILATVFFLFALFSKPAAVVVPFICGAVGVYLLQRPINQTIWELVPWGAIIIPFVVVAKLSQGDSELSFIPEFWQRFLIAGDSVSFYAAKLFYPVNLGFDYSRTPQFVLDNWWIYLTGVLPYFFVAMFFWKFRHPWVLSSLAVFIAGLFPVLGFLPFVHQEISTVADRYLYLPMLGPALLVSYIFLKQGKKVQKIVYLMIIILFGILSTFQVKTWKNPFTIYFQGLVINPTSWKSHDGLVKLYLHLDQPNEAKIHVREAIKTATQIAPHAGRAAESYTKLGIIYSKAKKDYNEAIHFLTKAIKIKPENPEAHYNLGFAYAEAEDFPKAIEHYEKALKLKPDYAFCYNDCSTLYWQLGKKEKSNQYRKKAAELGNFYAIEWLKKNNDVMQE